MLKSNRIDSKDAGPFLVVAVKSLIQALTQSQLSLTITHRAISVMLPWVTNNRRRFCNSNTKVLLPHLCCLTLYRTTSIIPYQV